MVKRRAVIAVCTLLSGCASWDPPSPPSSLPAPKTSADSVIVEIEFVRFEDGDAAWDDLWSRLDEQQYPVELRRQLAANGLRCGLIASELPASLRRALENKKPALQQLQMGLPPASDESFTNYRQLTCRSGRHYQITASPRSAERMLLISLDDKIIGERFTDAQAHFDLIASPIGGGRAEILLTPVVEHGKLKTQIVPGPASYHTNTGRDERPIESLAISSHLTSGSTLVVSSTPDAKGLGAWYFGESGARSVIMLRLLQAHANDLFLDETNLAPLTTSLD